MSVLAPGITRHERVDGVASRQVLETHAIYFLSNGHFDAHLQGALMHTARRVNAFRYFLHAGQNLVQLLTLAQQLSDQAVAAMTADTCRNQIAYTGEAKEGFALAA